MNYSISAMAHGFMSRVSSCLHAKMLGLLWSIFLINKILICLRRKKTLSTWQDRMKKTRKGNWWRQMLHQRVKDNLEDHPLPISQKLRSSNWLRHMAKMWCQLLGRRNLNNFFGQLSSLIGKLSTIKLIDQALNSSLRSLRQSVSAKWRSPTVKDNFTILSKYQTKLIKIRVSASQKRYQLRIRK